VHVRLEQAGLRRRPDRRHRVEGEVGGIGHASDPTGGDDVA
jgi:hypothetical protein